MENSLSLSKGITTPVREGEKMKEFEFYYFRLIEMYYYGFLSIKSPMNGILKHNRVFLQDEVILPDKPMIIHRSFVHRIGFQQPNTELFNLVAKQYFTIDESELTFLLIANGTVYHYNEFHKEHSMKAERFYYSFRR